MNWPTISATVHRLIVATGSLLAGFASLPAAFDTRVVGIDPQVFAICAVGAATAPLVATWWRSVTDPRAAPP